MITTAGPISLWLTMALRPISITTITTARSKRLAFPAAWLSRCKAAPWRQCASPSGITTTTAGSISTSPISRDPRTISGITMAKGFSTRSAIRPASRAPRTTCSASVGASSITTTMGWLDLFIANGHVYPEVEQATPEIHYKQINSLFHNEGNGKFVETTKLAGSGFQTPHVGRGVVFADFDNDGFVDVVVANNGDPPLLLHNSGGNGNHFLNFKLVGTKSNRDAMGGRIRIVVGGLSQIREVAGGGSYLSQSDLRANFGLGKATRVESVEITWPSGQRQVFHNVEADKFYLIEEGKDQLQMQKFAGNSRANAHILSGSMSSSSK